MLSVGRREDGRKRRGFVERGMMKEDNELEEGEAWSGQEDDSCVDPDALSYIDEKIHDVLGHFQKDFEADVSAETLGAKFGGYGSFLPTYQRSPSIFCQPRSPQTLTSQNVKRSPYNPLVEATNQNSSVQTSSSFAKNNTMVVPPQDNKCKRDDHMNKPNIQEPNSQHSFNKATNATDQSSLKVRIKVGQANTLPKNNAAIYSGLGLDISPSSSYEDSLDGSGGMSPEFQDLPDTSSIIKVMTCFVVPGGFLLSPLQENLFQLMEKETSVIKHSKREMTYKGMPQAGADFMDSTIFPGEVKSPMETHPRPRDQKSKQRKIKTSEGKADVTLRKKVDSAAAQVGQLTSNSLNIVVSSASKDMEKKSERLLIGNAEKNDNKMLDHPRETKKFTLKERSTVPGTVKEKHFDIVESAANNGAGSSGNEIMASNGKLISKASILEKVLGERISSKPNEEKTDLHREERNSVEKDTETSINHSSGVKRRNEQKAGTGPANHLNASSPYGEKVLQVKDQISNKKKKLKVSKANSSSLGEGSKEIISGYSSATSTEKKRTSHTKAGHVEKSKVLTSCKDLSGAWIRDSRTLNQDIKAEELDADHDPVDVNSSSKQKIMKDKHEKEPTISTQISREKSGSRKVDNTPIPGASAGEPAVPYLTCNSSVAGAAVAPQPPVFIQENWVCCDICQKWRLLPYGTSTDDLPKKWQCNLLSWLPGLNSCDVPEEETTSALHALYVVPPLENGVKPDVRQNVAPSNVSLTSGPTGLNLDQNVEVMNHNISATGKKKSAPKYASDRASHSTHTHIPNSVKKDQQASVKSGNSSGLKQDNPPELNGSNKGAFANAGRSTDLLNIGKQKQKQKDKLKNNGSYTDGGVYSGKVEKHSKSKVKREVHHDDPRAPKKPKKENMQIPDKDRSTHEITPKVIEETGYVKTEIQAAPSSQDRHSLERNECPKLLSGSGRSQYKLNSGDKQNSRIQGHAISSPLKTSRSDVDGIDATNAGASKVTKQCRQPEFNNGVHHNVQRHAAPNAPDTSSPMRKENHSHVLKEARDLKHTANRLKNEGLELESTGLYFEAALKFLHVAALMEPANFDIAKQAEAAKMYSETAKLCEFVAREYEKIKDMAVASLAYKCVEVAYLKAAYCRNPNASKDRHDLQTALQFLPPGESPSSSASDVDNFNNQTKNASAKSVNSPQVAGNHTIPARHHHQVLRLLHYTNDLNCAFEATRKSEICFTAASDRVDCISSVRKVLDVNFHNVQGLLRLVRLSRESIGR